MTVRLYLMRRGSVFLDLSVTEDEAREIVEDLLAQLDGRGQTR